MGPAPGAPTLGFGREVSALDRGAGATVGFLLMSKEEKLLMRYLLWSALMFLVVLFGPACRHSTLIPSKIDDPLSDTLTGTFADNPGGCGHVVVKVLSGSIADSSVEQFWTDGASGITYTNVFTVKDWIEIDQAQLSVGDTFTFTLNAPVPDSTLWYGCDIQPLHFDMPSVSNNVTNIQKVN